MKVFKYCKKCGRVMTQSIKYNCGYPIVEYFCPLCGKEKSNNTYTTNSTNWIKEDKR